LKQRVTAALGGSQFLRDGIWTLLFNLLTKSQAIAVILSGAIAGGITDIGRLTAGVAAAYLGSGLADFGFSSESGRFITANPSRETAHATQRKVAPRLLLGGVFGVLGYFVTVGRHAATADTTFYVLLFLMSAALTVSAITMQSLNGLGEFRRTATRFGGVRLVFGVAAVVAAWQLSDTNAVFGALAIGEIVSAVVLTVTFVRRVHTLPMSGVKSKLGLRYLWLGVGSTVNIVANRSDVLLVGAVASGSTLGVYSIASQLQNAIGTLALSPSAPLSIHIAGRRSNGADPTRTVRQAVRATLAVGLAAFVGAMLVYVGYLVSPFGSHVLRTPAAIVTVVLCACSAVPAALAGVFLAVAMGYRAQARVGVIRLINAAIAIPAFWVLTDLRGALGAASAAVLRDVSLLMLSYFGAVKLLAPAGRHGAATESDAGRPAERELAGVPASEPAGERS
jgi:hypothetical protein